MKEPVIEKTCLKKAFSAEMNNAVYWLRRRSRLRLLIVLASLSVASVSWSQDIHFSQYYFSPLSLNPAYTGKFAGDYRFFGNYRSQWREINNAYNTFSAGGDMSFYPNNLHLSGGLIIIRDLSGGNLLVNKIMPSGAWHTSLGRFNFHLGIQPGVVLKSIDFYSNSFPEQLNWNTGKFDPSMPNSEKNLSQRFIYADINSGIAISAKFGKFEPEIGFAGFHLNGPRESFFANPNRLPVRTAGNVSMTYSLDPVVIKVHSLYGYTDEVNDLVSGFQVEYVLSRNYFFSNSVFAGCMWRDGLKRNHDAGIFTAGLTYQNYTIGFSYDVTFSGLKTSVNSRGAFELAIIYRARNSRIQKILTPCERY